jgi:hypothetical protein
MKRRAKGTMRALVSLAAVLPVLAALATPAARADVPPLLTHQGRLLDAGGQPITGKQVLIYKIYDTATAGKDLWTETLTVDFDQGYFSVALGAVTPISDGLLAGGTRYLGIQVGADGEMTPREALGSVPYARLAGDVVNDIHPKSVTVAGTKVIDGAGNWAGPAPLRIADCMRVDSACGKGTYLQPIHFLDRVSGRCPVDHPVFNGFGFARCGTIGTPDEGLLFIMTCCALQR